jgi:hypothetical protein
MTAHMTSCRNIVKMIILKNPSSAVIQKKHAPGQAPKKALSIFSGSFTASKTATGEKDRNV